MARARSIEIYLKPGIEEDDQIYAVWAALRDRGRPQDVFRRMLRAGLKAMVDAGELPRVALRQVDPELLVPIPPAQALVVAAAGRARQTPPPPPPRRRGRPPNEVVAPVVECAERAMPPQDGDEADVFAAVRTALETNPPAQPPVAPAPVAPATDTVPAVSGPTDGTRISSEAAESYPSSEAPSASAAPAPTVMAPAAPVVAAAPVAAPAAPAAAPVVEPSADPGEAPVKRRPRLGRLM